MGLCGCYYVYINFFKRKEDEIDMRKKEEMQLNNLQNLRKKRGIKLFLFILPGMIYVFMFNYLPLWGLSYAFINYKPGRGVFDSDFVGFKNFITLFSNPVIRNNVFQSLKNTLGINALGFLCMPLPMIFAMFLNELRSAKFKKVVQTVSTLPHFISWVIMFSLAGGLFSINGLINTLLMDSGVINQPLNLLTTDKHVWIIQTVFSQWKEVGWASIVYFAAIAGIDQELYEAAMVDGAGRIKRMWYITVPHLIPTFFVLLIMKIGSVLSTGVEQYLVFGNAMNKEFIETFDLYVYNLGIGGGRISAGVAVGMMKSIVALTLFSGANWLSKKVRGYGIA